MARDSSQGLMASCDLFKAQLDPPLQAQLDALSIKGQLLSLLFEARLHDPLLRCERASKTNLVSTVCCRSVEAVDGHDRGSMAAVPFADAFVELQKALRDRSWADEAATTMTLVSVSLLACWPPRLRLDRILRTVTDPFCCSRRRQ